MTRQRYQKKGASMRRDMAKVVTERPRHGHANKSKKTSLRVRRYESEDQLDDLPKRISSGRHRQHGWMAKEFSDRIGPLKRFLRSRVGKNWDKVYSELSQNLDKRSLTGRHIWLHVWMEVERDCVIEGGKIFCREAHLGRRQEIWKSLYVHPETKILSWAKKHR